MGDMRQQLMLLENRPAWKLDAQTRLIGREGIAVARAVLTRAKTNQDQEYIRQQAAA